MEFMGAFEGRRNENPFRLLYNNDDDGDNVD
jgi:hypothetical protein